MTIPFLAKLATLFGAISLANKTNASQPPPIITIFTLPNGAGTVYRKTYRAFTLVVLREKVRQWPWTDVEQDNWHVAAYDKKGKLIGQAHPYPNDGKRPTGYDPAKPIKALEGAALGVDPKYRRKGIASAMYQFVEEVSQLPIVPSTIFQTDAGKAYTQRRKRVGPPSLFRAATTAEHEAAEAMLRKIFRDIP